MPDTPVPTQQWPLTADGRYLVLRTNRPDGVSYPGFRWTHEVGAIHEAPDWNPDPTIDCGGGLHGLLWGCGDAGLLHHVGESDSVWLVVAVAPGDVATPHAGGVPSKVRFRACEVVHVGDRVSAPAFIVAAGGGALPVVYGTATAGYRGTATAGNYGTATAGYRGTATAGNYGTATAGDGGTATAGNYGTATAGCGGTATAGDRGTATAGNYGTATAGDGGVISVEFWDGALNRYRRKIGEVDGHTLLAYTPYRIVDGDFVAVES